MFADQESILRCKQNFLATGLLSQSNLIRKEIAESWQRSKSSSVNPGMRILPAPPPLEQTKHLLNDFIKAENRKSYDYFESKHNLLSAYGAAVYYVGTDLNIYGRYGNPDLLAELRALNLRFGANLAEPRIGTNAAALAAATMGEAWVSGHEHYIEALRPYVCAATVIYLDNSPIIADKFPSFAMLIVPLSKFTPSVKAFFNFILQNDKSRGHIKTSLERYLKDLYLEQYFGQDGSFFLFLDTQGCIVYCNSSFFDLFQLDYKQVIDKPLNVIFPELQAALSHLDFTKPIPLAEISFDSLPQGKNNFLMECKAIKKDSGNIGMIITLSNSRKFEPIINQAANYRGRYTFHNLLGKNKSFINTKALALKAANSPSNLLIVGESGTGKELFAHSIHNASVRRNNPFVSINCGAIPKELIGSELFGYSEGAFTGARKGGAKGKFELADGGTIFLDEIGEMPLDMQSVLLRVLEDKIVTRLGSTKQTLIDVRLIAATNQDIPKLVEEGKFRLDLYYRLNVFRLDMIPLRERPEDIPLLIDNFLEQFSHSFQKNVTGVANDVIELLQSYNWPGNIRQLRNIIERSVNITDSSQISLEDLPVDFLKLTGKKTTPQGENPSFSKMNQNHKLQERQLIERLMMKHNGNKTMVAQEMGLSRQALYRKLEKMSLT